MGLEKQYNIKWKREDYLTLGRAVSQFNKKINKLNAEERRLYLPENITYKEIKENITTRAELKRVISSLKRFSKQGAEELYKTEAGIEITKWEKQELSYQKQIATRRLKKELAELNIPVAGEKYSRVQMGTGKVEQIQARIESLQMLEKRTGYEFQKLKERIRNLGTLDYEFKKANIYRENMMDKLEGLALNHEEFQKVFEYFNKIKNPITFFEIAQRSRALQDFFEWYDRPDSYASFRTANDLADYILKEYGLIE